MTKRFVDSEGSVAGAVFDVHAAALGNRSYRRVFFTGYAQIVLYSLEPNETLPLESHCEAAQFLNVVSGQGRVFIGEDNTTIKPNDTVAIMPGAPHRVVNESEQGDPLRMWSVYTAPQFLENRVDERQPVRAGLPVMELGEGFERGLVINEVEGDNDHVCLTRDGTPVCGHTHDLDTLKKWLLFGTCEGGEMCPVCADEATPIQLNIPRLRRKKKETKGTEENVDTWAPIRPRTSTRGKPTVVVSVVKEDPRQHPWAGEDKKNPKKFALAGIAPWAIEGIPYESMKKPTQGVHLILQAGGPYVFNTKKVLAKYPFYFTKSIVGGMGIAQRDNLALRSSPAEATNRGKATLFLTAPNTPGLWVAYYQCTRFNNMGGPVSVHPAGQPPVFTAGDSMVLRDEASGTFSVMSKGSDSIRAGLDFDTALAAVGACVRTQFVFTVDGKVDCTTIVPEEDCNATTEDCPFHDDEPAVLFCGGGTARYCDHIHPLGELRQWLQSNDTDALCPTCAK